MILDYLIAAALIALIAWATYGLVEYWKHLGDDTPGRNR